MVLQINYTDLLFIRNCKQLNEEKKWKYHVFKGLSHQFLRVYEKFFNFPFNDACKNHLLKLIKNRRKINKNECQVINSFNSFYSPIESTFSCFIYFIWHISKSSMALLLLLLLQQQSILNANWVEQFTKFCRQFLRHIIAFCLFKCPFAMLSLFASGYIHCNE